MGLKITTSETGPPNVLFEKEENPIKSFFEGINERSRVKAAEQRAMNADRRAEADSIMRQAQHKFKMDTLKKTEDMLNLKNKYTSTGDMSQLLSSDDWMNFKTPNIATNWNQYKADAEDKGINPDRAAFFASFNANNKQLGDLLSTKLDKAYEAVKKRPENRYATAEEISRLVNTEYNGNEILKQIAIAGGQPPLYQPAAPSIPWSELPSEAGEYVKSIFIDPTTDESKITGKGIAAGGLAVGTAGLASKAVLGKAKDLILGPAGEVVKDDDVWKTAIKENPSIKTLAKGAADTKTANKIRKFGRNLTAREFQDPASLRSLEKMSQEYFEKHGVHPLDKKDIDEIIKKAKDSGLKGKKLKNWARSLRGLGVAAIASQAKKLVGETGQIVAGDVGEKIGRVGVDAALTGYMGKEAIESIARATATTKAGGKVSAKGFANWLLKGGKLKKWLGKKAAKAGAKQLAVAGTGLGASPWVQIPLMMAQLGLTGLQAKELWEEYNKDTGQ